MAGIKHIQAHRQTRQFCMRPEHPFLLLLLLEGRTCKHEVCSCGIALMPSNTKPVSTNSQARSLSSAFDTF